MSKYTVELRYICETAAGLEESVGDNDVENVIQKALPNIFSFNFPIFDETYRSVLETKILRHYYTREIAFETVGLWKLKLRTKLNEIMPYFNKLYQSELLDFNPLYDVDLIRTHVKDSSGTRDTSGKTDSENSSRTEQNGSNSQTTDRNVNTSVNNTNNSTDDGTVNRTGSNTDKYSDTPQGAITDLAADRYLTNARLVSETEGTATHGENNTTQTGSTESTDNTEVNSDSENVTEVSGSTNSNTTENVNMTDTEEYLEHVSGKQGTGSYSDMILKYRETFLNIDLQVIESLEDLFFQLW